MLNVSPMVEHLHQCHLSLLVALLPFPSQCLFQLKVSTGKVPPKSSFEIPAQFLLASPWLWWELDQTPSGAYVAAVSFSLLAAAP